MVLSELILFAWWRLENKSFYGLIHLLGGEIGPGLGRDLQLSRRLIYVDLLVSF
jgi:hypothetical protein